MGRLCGDAWQFHFLWEGELYGNARAFHYYFRHLLEVDPLVEFLEYIYWCVEYWSIELFTSHQDSHIQITCWNYSFVYAVYQVHTSHY